MLKTIKYRLYPTEKQKVLLDKHIYASRFVYNIALETKKAAYVNRINLSRFDLIKQLPELKKECNWLNEVSAQSLQHSIVNLDIAYDRYFKGISNFPKYKSRKNSKQAFTIPQNISLNIESKTIKLSKFTEGIKAKLHRTLNGKIKRATISVTSTGKYFASVLIETLNNTREKNKITLENTIGIDLGIKDFLITSNGEVISNPKFLKNSLIKLKYSQRTYSKYKGKKKRKKLVKLHEKIVNQRLDFLHKVSTKVISDNQTIALETLKIKEMLKNHTFAQSIIDVSWAKFTQMLEYKGEWYGVNVLRIGRFEPSSKSCSNCGYINNELKLSDRKWKCNMCDTIHDRDINAALNIKNFALRNYVSGTDTQTHSELPALVGVMTYDANLPLVL